ncbi:copine-9-like [Echeneis naucrates]|uniref:copine-9-like n=1 Tax=Echeneis naucrates TaxID=173247 RepID=UPI001114429E|nr:copine-9-like [Echeneis naucrates]
MDQIFTLARILEGASEYAYAVYMCFVDLEKVYDPIPLDMLWEVLQEYGSGDSENPNCVGIEGVLEAYFQSLRTVQLYGPTNFAPVINKVANCAAEITDGSQYFVLLMITDGVISDMVQTKEAVVNAASLPMSIIIVGVGPAEFDAMEELDGDEVRVSSRGRLAERDIVQFVPFRDYIDRSGNQVLSMARLAKDVLAEIPDQLLSFMKSRSIEPRPAISSSPLPGLHRHI